MKGMIVTLALIAAAGELTSTYPNCTSTTDCVNILFIGNSFTHANAPVFHYNNANVHDFNGSAMGGVPGIFQKLATDGGRSNLAVNIEAVSGITLAWHLANRSGVITNPGSYGPWDWVVLQDYSTRPTAVTAVGGNIAGFRSNVQSLNHLATNNNPGVKTLLYCTWGRPDLVAAGYFTSIQSMQAQLTTNYSDAARDFNLFGYAPVGDSFMEAVACGLSINPNITNTPGPGQINLWYSDNYHASIYGSYLAALVFYARILGSDPRELPNGAGSAAADLGISSTVAAQLQNVAYNTVLGPSIPDFSLVVAPNTETVIIESNVAYTVTVGATNGFVGEIALTITGLPSNVSADFSSILLTNAGTSTLVLTAFSNAVPGSYVLTVSGTSTNITHSFNITLSINAPDFALLVTPEIHLTSPGTNVAYTVDITATNGFSGEILLSATGLPANVSADFSFSALTNSGTSTLLLTIATNAAPGNFPLTVVGTSSSLSRTSVVTLVIQALASEIPDWWKEQYFGCTNCPQAAADSDPDGDGMSNGKEFLAGTDPTDSASTFRITSCIQTGDDLLVSWSTIDGKTNALQAMNGDSTNFQFTNNFADIFIATNTVGTSTNYLDVGAVTNSPARYYRVKLVS